MLKQSKVHIHEKEVSIKAAQTEIAKFEKQLGEISTKKEYDALRRRSARCATASVRSKTKSWC